MYRMHKGLVNLCCSGLIIGIYFTSSYANGVDLNCGCPQKWAVHEKIGAHLMEDPELVRDMVRQVKSRTSGVRMADGDPFPCSVKIRVHPDLKKTVEFVRRAESIGVVDLWPYFLKKDNLKDARKCAQKVCFQISFKAVCVTLTHFRMLNSVSPSIVYSR